MKVMGPSVKHGSSVRFKPLKTKKSFIKHIGNQLVRSVGLACSTRKNRGCFNPDLQGPLGTFSTVQLSVGAVVVLSELYVFL